jgi:proteasome accessory factor B
VISRGGRWYVGGRDRDRDAPRVFRLSRIDSAVTRIGRPGSYAVPADLDPKELVAPMRQRPDDRRARLRVRPGRAVTLRRRALDVAEGGAADGWDDVTVQVGDLAMLEEELAGYGPDVVVLAPDDLRQGVVRRLRAALAGSGVVTERAGVRAAAGEDPA